MEFRFQVQTKIQRPVAEVFDAVYNPTKLQQYFTTARASAPLDAGTTVIWGFADYPGEFPVHVKRCEPNALIVLEWKAMDGDYNTRIEMKFEPLGPNETLVIVGESGWRETEEGLKSSYGNCFGWAHMTCCLKAWVEYGINLRTGAF